MTNNSSNTNSQSEDIYNDGADHIISGAVCFSTPFANMGNVLLKNIPLLKTGLSSDTEFLLKDMQNELQTFIKNFHEYSYMFVEKVTEETANLIRRKTDRADLRAMTTDRIASALRDESFKKFDESLTEITNQIQSLGISLKSVSVLNSVTARGSQGAGLQFLAGKSGGRETQAGLVVGAAYGAFTAIREQEKLKNKSF